MPVFHGIYKAGKLSFLLVCLFLCTACKKQDLSFTAGEPVAEYRETVVQQSVTVQETQKETIAEESPVMEEEKALLVNINTATVEELMTLPGIGQVRAESIVSYRQREGNFKKIEDVMNVKGIKTGIFSKISSLICVK